MTEVTEDVASGIHSLLADEKVSRDEIFASVAQPKTRKKSFGGGKKKSSTKNRFLSLIRGNQSSKSAQNFQLSGPTNFRQAAHIGYNPDTGTFEVSLKI